jgi:hypothetical protein
MVRRKIHALLGLLVLVDAVLRLLWQAVSELAADRLPQIWPRLRLTASRSRIVQWREGHSTTVLADGRVLVAGGRGLNSAEVYDPESARWSPTGPMHARRHFHSATLLRDGRVLVAGGSNGHRLRMSANILASAELFDPATGVWRATEPMRAARYGYAAILLPSGQVLVSGGTGVDTGEAAREKSLGLRSTEVFDPVIGSWTSAPAMHLPRSHHAAMMLPDGRVLVIAGTPSAGADSETRRTARNTGEVFDPQTGAWHVTSAMNNPYGFFSFVGIGLLPEGRMIGLLGSGESARVVTYDPVADRWDDLPAIGPGYHTHMSPPGNPSVSIALLPDGRVLASGGVSQETGGSAADAAVFDPATLIWTPIGRMTGPREGHTTVVLRSGGVLAFGGRRQRSVDYPALRVLTSEVYDPTTGAWSPSGRRSGIAQTQPSAPATSATSAAQAQAVERVALFRRLREALVSTEDVARWEDGLVIEHEFPLPGVAGHARAFLRHDYARPGVVEVRLKSADATSVAAAAEDIVRTAFNGPGPIWGEQAPRVEPPFRPDGFGADAIAHLFAGTTDQRVPYSGLLILWAEDGVQAMVMALSGPPPAGHSPSPRTLRLAESQRDRLRAVLRK